MQSPNRSLFKKCVAVFIVCVFIANSSGLAYAQNYLKPSGGRDSDAVGLATDLIKTGNTENKDGGIMGDYLAERNLKKALVQLNDPDEKIRYKAITALGNSKDERVVEPLTRMLKFDGVPNNRVQIARMLSGFSWAMDRVTDPLIEALKDDYKDVRLEALKSLTELKPAKAIDAVMPIALKDVYPDVRYWAVMFLSKFPDKRIVDTLIRAVEVEGKFSEIQAKAAEALGAVGDERAFLPLINLARDPEKGRDARSAAIKAMGNFKHNSELIANVLIGLLDNPKEDSDVLIAAINTLGQLGTLRAEDSIIRVLRGSKGYKDYHVSLACISALAQIGSTKAFLPLSIILKDPDGFPVHRQRAILALAKLGDERLIDILINIVLNVSEDIDVQKTAAITLGELGDKKAVKDLIYVLVHYQRQITGSGDVGVIIRAASAQALGKLKDPSAKEPLYQASLNDKQESVRISAALALLELGDTRSVLFLKGVLANEKAYKEDLLNAIRAALIKNGVEVPTASKDGGKMTIAVVGGTKGSIGEGYADRYAKTGLFNVRKGSRSEQNLEKGIYLNKDAVVGAKFVKIATPASVKGQPALQAWKDTLIKKDTGIAKFIEKDAIIIVMGNAIAKDDQAALAAEGFTSLGEITQALINKAVPEKNIKVVECFNSAPGEWVTFLDYQLKIDVVTVGDDQQACQFVIDNYINKLEGLNGVYAGPLAYGKYLEFMTKLIIQSKKQLLIGLPLKTLFDHIVELKGKVTAEEMKAFNQEAFDAQVRAIASDPQKVTNYIETLKWARRYSPSDEITSIILRRYAEMIKSSDPKTCDLITQACNECDLVMLADRESKKSAGKAPAAAPQVLTEAQKSEIRSAKIAADRQINKEMPGDFETVAKAIKVVAGPNAAVAIDGELIADNPGLMDLMRQIRSQETRNLRVVISAVEEDLFQRLSLIGADEIGKIERRNMIEIANSFEITREKEVQALIAPADKIKELNTKGMLVYRVQKPEIRSDKAAYILPWTLIWADLLAKIYDDKGVTDAVSQIKTSYKDSGMVSQQDLAKLTDIVSDVAVVAVTDEDMKKEIDAYIARAISG
jgi:HEAT repeat protein/predicted dinucleotide-binding enzyme